MIEFMTGETLTADLRSLGLASGDTVLVHSSFRSLGWICGGSEAVVLALLAAIGTDGLPGDVPGQTSRAADGGDEEVGERGTLVVPTHTGDNSDPAEWQHPPVPPSWWPVIRASTPAYDPAVSRTRGMGAIAETVRTWPGAVRSAHPQTSFAALGPRAVDLMAGHAMDCRLGERSPLARLDEAAEDGQRRVLVLLLGVGFDCCTAFHLAEYRVDPPPPEATCSFAAFVEDRRADGGVRRLRQWMTVREPQISEDGFNELGAHFELDRAPVVARGKIGGADARLFPLSEAVAYAKAWLTINRPNKVLS